MIVHFSPNGQYVSLMERRNKELYLLRVLCLPSFEPILAFPYKSYFKEHWPLFQFDSLDAYGFRVSHDTHPELEVYELRTGQLVNSLALNHTVD